RIRPRLVTRRRILPHRLPDLLVQLPREQIHRLRLHEISPPFRSASRKICTTCRVFTARPAFSALPPKCIKHPISPETSTSGFPAAPCSSFKPPSAAEIDGNVTANVPPNPQHCSPSPNETTSSPVIDSSKRIVAGPLFVPRE